MQLTVVLDAPPAVASWVLTQALVLLPGGVASPLQDWNVLQKRPAKFGVGDPSPDAVGAGLKRADNSVLVSARVAYRSCKHQQRVPHHTANITNETLTSKARFPRSCSADLRRAASLRHKFHTKLNIM